MPANSEPIFEVDGRTLGVCQDCVGCDQQSSPNEALLLLGSNWDDADDASQPPFMQRREVLTLKAHLGTFILVNSIDTPDDGIVLMDCIIDSVNACTGGEPVEFGDNRYCPAVIEAGKLFYKKTGKG